MELPFLCTLSPDEISNRQSSPNLSGVQTKRSSFKIDLRGASRIEFETYSALIDWFGRKQRSTSTHHDCEWKEKKSPWIMPSLHLLTIYIYITMYKAEQNVTGSHCRVSVLVVCLTIPSRAHNSIDRDLPQNKATRRLLTALPHSKRPPTNKTAFAPSDPEIRL